MSSIDELITKYSADKYQMSGTKKSNAASGDGKSGTQKASGPKTIDELIGIYSDKKYQIGGNKDLDAAIMKPFAGPVSIMNQKPDVVDYEGDYTKKVNSQKQTGTTAKFDSGSVLKLGAGPLSDNAVAQKVNAGELRVIGQTKDGKYTVEKNPDYVPTYSPKPATVRLPTEEELALYNAEREYGKGEEMGDNFFSWLGKSQDSTLPTAALTGRRADAAGKTVGAAAENVAGSIMNMVGFLGDMAFQGLQNQVAVETGINADKRGENGDEVYSQIVDKNTAANAQKEQLFAPVVDTLMTNAEQLHQEAYVAAGKEGKFLVDLLYTGTQMAGDLVANMIVPGSGLALMASRVFGQSAYEARMAGADQATQLVTGLKAAVIEYLTEKLGGGAFKKFYGAGIVDNAIESMLGRLLKTDKGRTVIRFLLECTGEGLEEVISDIANPVADRMLGLDDGTGAIITDDDLSQMWYDFALGTALGGMGSAVNLTTGSYDTQNASLRAAEAAQKALIESGLESDKSTDSYKLAEKYQKTLESGRLLSNRQVQKLTEANDAAIRMEVAQQSADDAVRNATPEHIAKLFAQRGEQASPELVEGVSNLLNDRSVTPEQVQAIEQSSNAAQVVQELVMEPAQSTAAEEAPTIDEPMEAWDMDNIVESMFPNEVKSGILSAQDVADIQSYYDLSGRSMDLDELENTVRGYIDNKNKEASNNVRRNAVDGSMERGAGQSSGEQGEGVSEGTGRDKSEKRGNDTRGEETRRSAGKKSQREKVSGKRLNIPNGTESQKLTVVKPDGANARIVDAFSGAAKSITLVNGAIEQQINDAVINVSGLTTGDGRVFARADHRLYNGTKLLLHECGHLYMDDAQMRRDMHNAAAELLSERTLEEMANSYALLWKGLYKMPAGITTDEELAEYFENNPDAYADFLDTYEQEIWCDALAGLDRIKAAGASKLTDAVRSIFKDYTGIDVDAILSGAETGNTAVRTEQGKAERIAPRNNGPPGERYSYGGETAKTADVNTLAEAKELYENGNDPETVRRQTGWFKGLDGKWRFEIDDSEAKFTEPESRFSKLSDLLEHDELYKAYPWLKDAFVNYAELGGTTIGSYNTTFGSFQLDDTLRGKPAAEQKKVLLHEVQHAIQDTEEFAGGSSVETWQKRIDAGYDSRTKLVKDEERRLFEQYNKLRKEKPTFFYAMEELVNDEPTVPRGEIDWETFEQIEPDPIEWQEFDKRRDELENVYGSEEVFDFFLLCDYLNKVARNEGRTATELYYNTAGEIEARDTANRSELTAEERKNTRPDIDRTDVVFADSNESYSYFSSDENYKESESKALLRLVRKYEEVIPETITYDVKGDGIVNGVKSAYITDIFDSQGNIAHRDDLGDIELSKTGAESTVFHGFGANKLIAAQGIKSALENGVIISKIENYKNTGKTRYVIAASGKVNNLDSIMAVAIEEYVLEGGRKAFYLHEVLIKNKDTSPIMADQQRAGTAGKVSSKDSIRNPSEDVNSFSADDALLVEGEEGYADTLSKVREDARRYSMKMLEEKLSNLDGRIKGYEDTENRTERMELELQDLRNRRKVYSDALKRKKAKAAEQKQGRQNAKSEAQEIAQRITDVQGRSKSKQQLRDTIFRDFNIVESRAEAADIINAFADKYAEQGKISRKDVNALFNALMQRGVFVVEAEDYAAELRAHLAGNSVRVPSEVKAEFGDDWLAFYRRAWGNKIYLKVDSGSNGIDTWTMELADAFGEGTFDVSADLKTQLERIVELAEQGKAEKMDLFQMAEYVRRREGKDTAEAMIDDLYSKMEAALKNYASNAKLEMELTYKNAFQQARDRAVRQENARRAQEKKAMRERQQDTLKQLQALKRMRDSTSKEFREQIDKVLEGIDTIAVSAANAMNYSDKYNASWGSLVAMYKEAKANDPNFLPDAYLDKLMERIEGKHLADMEPADIEQLYQAAVALRTKIYNTQNIIGSETNMLFDEAYESVTSEMRAADKPKNRYGAKWKAMRNVLNPNHYLECLAGWNPDSVWYKTFTKGLEDGERAMKRYVETSKQMLDEFVETHKAWLEIADGQGKNGIWYEIKVSPVAEWRKGDQPIFGEPITAYMTPLQKIHMYLESKNYDNLAHMLGGRVFADKEIYSEGNKAEAFASDPIHLAPADVRRISSDLTAEEMELANILERYYNTYAKEEINKVSNVLYGFDRAMATNYAPIFTKETYNAFTPAILDGTAEGVGHMKTRMKGARTPTLNLSAMEAFDKHVSQTSRFVGMAIPLHNMNGILNWTQHGKSMRSVIEQEWSKADREYIEQLMTDLQNPNFSDTGYIEKTIDKIQSAYIGSVFGFNPSVALKVFASWNIASVELGFENAKGAFAKVDTELIRKYTSEYDVRVRGYASPEVARLVNSQGRIEKAIQSNALTKELFGGGLMIHTDAMVARSMWAWAEAAVRNENPELEVGTQEEVDAGQSPFYKAVAEKFNTAMGNTQSMYDIMHRSAMLRSEGAVDRAFTMFHTDIMQAANLLMKARGESAYYRKAAAADPENKALQEKAAKYEHAVAKAAVGAVTSSMVVALVTVLNSLLKRRDDFYDENGEFMWSKLGIDYVVYVLKDFTGMLPGIPETILGAGIDLAKGEKWYEVEIMGLGLFNDLVETTTQFAGKVINGTATANDVKKVAFMVMRLFGLPLDNVERYILGTLSWVSPEFGEAYNNMIVAPEKSGLKGKTGDVLERDVYDMYKQFGMDRETTDELARLYELGHDKIIMGSIPTKLTIDGVEYELDKDAVEKFKQGRTEVLSLLGKVIQSAEYQNADDKTRVDMLKRLNSFADETAKAAAIPEYDMAQWADSCQDLIDMGKDIAAVALMPYSEKKQSSGSDEDNDPRYVKFVKAGVEYNNARDMENELAALTPAAGNKSVTQSQKVAAIAYMPIPENEKAAAIKIIYGTNGEKSYEKYTTATAYCSSVQYVDFVSTLDRINDNSGVSQQEFLTAAKSSGLPVDAAAALWQTYGWKKTFPGY